MDVRCTRCSIEYEFDDAKVTPGGVTVKCTNCGHVFKVSRDQATAPEGGLAAFPDEVSSSSLSGGRGPTEWMVRQGSGTVLRCRELTTLQKWIVERKVAREDEISKTGRTWRKLGEIAELASFFQVVDAATAASRSTAAAGGSESAADPLWRSPTGTHRPGANISVEDVSTQRMPGPTAADDPLAPSSMAQASAEENAAAAFEAALGSGSFSSFASGPSQSGGRALSGVNALDADDPVLDWRKRRQRQVLVVTAVVTALTLGVVAVVFRDALGLTPSSPGMPSSLKQSVAAAVRDGARAPLLDALKALAPLAERQPPDADALVAQARAHIALAAIDNELARLSRQIAAGTTPPDAAVVSAGQAAEARAAQSLAAAYQLIGAVRADGVPRVELNLAAAAYQLERGGVAEQRAELEAAVHGAATDSAVDHTAVDVEVAVQTALLSAQQALAGDAAGLDRALALLPETSPDPRLRYARAALLVQKAGLERTDGALAAARTAKSALASSDPRVQALEALLTQHAAALAAAATAADAGPETATADAGPAADATPAVDAGPAPTLASMPFEVLMAQGERARINERARTAYPFFLEATKQRPQSPRAWLALGWTALDLGHAKEAVRAFERAEALDATLSDAVFGKAEALRFSGNKPRAVEAYRAYLRMDPNGKDANVARNAIEALGGD